MRYAGAFAVVLMACSYFPVGKYHMVGDDHNAILNMYSNDTFEADVIDHLTHNELHIRGHWERFEPKSFFLIGDSSQDEFSRSAPLLNEVSRAKFDVVGNGGDLEVTDGSLEFHRGEHFTKVSNDPNPTPTPFRSQPNYDSLCASAGKDTLCVCTPTMWTCRAR